MLRFYAELNDFLPEHRRQRSFTHRLPLAASVKDVIEALGVPHTEVDVVLVNGESVGFDRVVADGDRVAVYPVFESLDVGPVLRLRPEPLRDTRFVLDTHLGRLARLLRLLGFDSRYANQADDADLARTSVDEARILLTRDRGLLKRGMVTHGYCVRSTDPDEQIVEVIERFDIGARFRPFTRCLECNGVIEPVAASDVAAAVPEGVREQHNDFRRCGDCRRVYWPGTHHQRLEALVARLTERARAPRSLR